MVTICKAASNRVRAKTSNAAAVMVTPAGDERPDCGVSRKARRASVLPDEAPSRSFHCEARTLFQPEHPNTDVVNRCDSERVVDFLTDEYTAGETMADKVAVGLLDESHVLAAEPQPEPAAKSDHGVKRIEHSGATLQVDPAVKAELSKLPLSELRRRMNVEMAQRRSEIRKFQVRQDGE